MEVNGRQRMCCPCRRCGENKNESMEAENKTHSQPPPLWSDLPLYLAGLVLSLLPAYADRARFAAVCPQWRAAARQKLQTPALPLLALPNRTFYSIPYDKAFRFPGCGFAGYKSVCGSWLVFPRDDGCFLVNPFSRAVVTLPPLSSVRLRPPNAVAKWSLEHGSKYADPYPTWMHINKSKKLHAIKLILCSSNLVAALVGVQHTSQILICQPGALSWSVRACDECKDFEDMAFYQGKLYALDDDENLLVVNISNDQSTGDPQVSRIGRVIEGKADFRLYYVASEENGLPVKKLYLVPEIRPGGPRKAIAGQSEFEVFEADFEHSRWIKVSTMGDNQVLFLGRRCSRAVAVSRYGLLGNHIFFLDDDDEYRVDYSYVEENTECSAYDMQLGDISSPHPMISWKRRKEMRLAAWLFPQD
ncbi:hypothetical protein CFC21_004106 [Triticum aestivum]|uniref:KIB1-4 beta-propeller domain-containing protein n=2 Tax=Triticum TaxID=4564 RepID=A0A9R0V368_TRITD|nr:hypothetical protein CFC21_004106 [Triticum aestivum]VAH10497.1 unnamed protein product [Triticum turgidum subsp. durum]